jgi:hypothetical protein
VARALVLWLTITGNGEQPALFAHNPGSPVFLSLFQLIKNNSSKLVHRLQDEGNEGEKFMSKKQDNRVLSRQLARDLTTQELEVITGGFFTNPNRDVTTTFCTLASDGDDD